MSDQTARPKANSLTGAKLENLYKPVGIAALNAAALCSQFKTHKKSN
ncbi:MAG: hypothetical protein ABJL55_15445 [Roseibium sp.]